MLGFDFEPVPFARVTTGGDGCSAMARSSNTRTWRATPSSTPPAPRGQLVAYDPGYLTGSTARTEATLSGEWAHVIGAQLVEIDLASDPDGLPIDAELQAGCLSGAWATTEATADIDVLGADSADPSGVEWRRNRRPDAHGTVEKRTLAFDIGLGGGPSACVDDLLDSLEG